MIVPVEFDIRIGQFYSCNNFYTVLHVEVIVVRKSFTVVLVLSYSLLAGYASGQATNTQRGAVTGGAAGAIIGGIIGHQNDETPEGALIGGAVGAIAGGLLGNQKDRVNYDAYQYQQQRAYQQAADFSRGVSVNDVVSLSQSGVSSNVIVSQIQTHGVQQQIGVNEIISLHRQGVDNQVISVMQQAHLAGSHSGPIATTPQYRTPPAVAIERPVIVERPIVIQPRPVVVAKQPVVIKRYPSYGYSRPRPHPHHRHRAAGPSINFHYRR